MITVIGIFEDIQLAEDASEYLIANEFEQENIDMHTSGTDIDQRDLVTVFFKHLFDDEKQAAHYASLGRDGTVVTVHALSTREAQEAVDVLNNYGAIDVKANANDPSQHSQVIERIVAEDQRLKN